MESGGGGAVMLPLFRERGRHARTPSPSPGPPRSTSHHYHPPSPPATRAPSQSTPSRLRGMLIPGALILTNISLVPGDDRGVAEKTRAKMKKRKKEKKKRMRRVVQERGKTLKTRLVLLRYPSDDSRTFSRTVFALAFTFRFLWILSLEDSFRLLLARPTNLFLGFDGV